MHRTTCIGLFLLLILCKFASGQTDIYTVDGLQHTGAIHFYAQPGPLNITVFKKDGNRGTPVNLTMTTYLTGPDGAVLDSARLYQSGKRTLSATVDAAGIYTLFLSMNGDQYVQGVTFGFSSNVGKYMIDAATGHADREREEPILLNGADSTFGVFFKPVEKEFTLNLSELPKTVSQVELYDGTGTLQKNIRVTDGQAAASLDPSEDQMEGVWELRLPVQKGKIHISGITRDWAEGDKPAPVWTTSRAAYFDVAAYHWLLSPRRFARHVKPGEKGKMELTVANRGTTTMFVDIHSEGAFAAVGHLRIVPERLEVGRGETAKVQVFYELPADIQSGDYDVRVVARDVRNNMQAYSLLEWRLNESTPIQLPIRLRLFDHAQFQFANDPDYPRDNQFYFDRHNRPWVITADGLKVWVDGTWETVVVADGSKQVVYPGSTIGTDQDGFVYTVVEIDGKPNLLRVSSDRKRPQLVALPVGGTYKMETFMGGKVSTYPPVVLRYLRDTSKKKVSFWANVHRLELFVTHVVDGRLTVDAPVVVSENCVGTSDHSGITNAVAADGDQLFLIWGETSDPAKNDPGVPTYTATYDRAHGVLSAPVFLTYSPPVNDVHNMSTLLVDRKGNRHVIVGAHGKPFQYLYCPVGTENWTQAKPISSMDQTYVGAVLDANDEIHLFCRTWRRDAQFPGTFEAALYYQHMKNGVWEEQTPFALAPLPGYSIFYHRLTVDRRGKLYLSFDYWSTWSAYRDSYLTAEDKRRGNSRLVLSSDDGRNWEIYKPYFLKKTK